jgi:hypothetical protein
MVAARRFRARWRDYRTASGARPVKEALDALTDDELATVVAGMKVCALPAPS